jgi:membrane associated rhomboid family serine protease
MLVTYAIIAATVLVSIFCFNSGPLFEALSLKPNRVVERREWYRVITHGFVHGDYTHLIVNMFVLFSFGSFVEPLFDRLHQSGITGNGTANYLLLYFGGMAAATIRDLVRNRHNPYYTSIGASGAVSAVLFTSIFFDPWGRIYLFAVIPIPGLLFGVLYLAYSHCSGRRGRDRVNHFARNPKDNPFVVTISLLFNHFQRIFILNYERWRAKKEQRPMPQEVELARLLKLPNPFFLKEYQLAANHYPTARVFTIFGLLRSYDLKSKGVDAGSADEGELLRELLLKIMLN